MGKECTGVQTVGNPVWQNIIEDENAMQLRAWTLEPVCLGSDPNSADY